ncbi:MAG: PKD domain-containing protein, partial [Methanoregula sp.]|nr:PKD domain-containing protein [Methanoregula sp.]
LMGGRDSNYKNDVWQSADYGVTWTQINASAGWSARGYHSSVVMPDGSIILMGGMDDISGKNDVWRSTDNGATWIQMTASAGWSARYGHTSVAMPDGSMILMGGSGSSGYKNDVWRSTDYGTTWTLVNANAGWSARSYHSSVVMPDSSIVLMGGGDSDGKKNDVWRLMPTGSVEQNPSHSYTTPGIYSVALRVYNAGGYNNTQKTGYITVLEPLPVASFIANKTDGIAPLTIQFTDRSTNSPTAWMWNATNVTGNNTPFTFSTSQNASQVFGKGNFSIILKATNSGGSGLSNQVTFINVSEPVPVANFSSDKTSGTAPLTIQFMDKSTNNPTSWIWNATNVTGNNTAFTFSNSQNPSQVFGKGNFSIILIAFNSGGSGISTRISFINVSEPIPIASFSTDKTSGTAPVTINFSDSSTNNPTSWVWNATNVTGNNTAFTFSNSQNPSCVFGKGNFSISLKATNSGGYGISTQVTFINVSEPIPVVRFNANKFTGSAPLLVKFTDNSTNNPSGWIWNATNVTGNNIPFTFSLSQNPLVIFNKGNFSISLMANNSGGSNLSTQITFINVSEPVPLPNFTAIPTSGTEPLTVTFTDTSTNSPTQWLWNFGDCSLVNATVQHPVHTYANAGIYNVSLNASNDGGSNTTTRYNFITVRIPAPVANFTATPTSGAVPLTVRFNDTSTNTPTQWTWNFGDGSSAVTQHPVHTYTTPGSYTVSLNATNTGGSNTKVITNHINVTPPPIIPIPNFTATPTSGTAPVTVTFTDNSTNAPTRWNWSFGDSQWFNTTDPLQRNPVHTYTDAGVFTVSLAAGNPNGTNILTRPGYITVAENTSYRARLILPEVSVYQNTSTKVPIQVA